MAYNEQTEISTISMINNITSEIQQNTHPIVLAIDVSGSVSLNNTYHTTIKLLNEKIKHIKQQSYILLWNHKFVIASDNDLMYVYEKQWGTGGTSTSAISNGLEKLNIKKPINLIIVTDGDVDLNDIEIADNKVKNLEKHHGLSITHMYGIIIGNNNNSSVLSPFFRACSFTIYNVNKSITGIVSSIIMTMNMIEKDEIFRCLDTISTIDELKSMYDNIIKLFTSMTMGLANPSLDSSILLVRNKILYIAKRIKTTAGIMNIPAVDVFTNSLTTSHTSTVEQMKEVFDAYYATFAGDELQSLINNLLALLDGKFSNIFDPTQIRKSMMTRTSVAIPVVKPSDLPPQVVDSTSSLATCPITLEYVDGKNMVILIKNSYCNIWNKLDKNTQDAIKTNPFVVLSSHVGELIKSALDHGISVEACNTMMDHNMVRSPITREECSGFLVLGNDIQSIKTANTALAKLVSNGTEIHGNINLWFYAIYILVDKIEWLQEMKPMILTQMKSRLMQPSSTTLSFSGLPTYVQFRGSLAAACFFNLHQPIFVKDVSKSSFRLNWSSSMHMMNLLEMANYQGIHLSNIKKYIVLLKTLAYLVNDVKKLHYPTFRIKYNTLTHKSITFGDVDYTPEFLINAKASNYVLYYVLFDGLLNHVPPVMKSFTDDVSPSFVFKLSQLIKNESVSIWDVAPSFELCDSFYSPIQLENVCNWTLNNDYTPALCQKTMRPYSVIDNGKHWTTSYCEKFNPDEKYMQHSKIFTPDGNTLRPVFAGYQYYINFVTKYGFYPKLADYATYVFNSLMNSQYAYHTIPKMSWLVDIITQYSKIVKSIHPNQFINITKISRERKIRRMMEIGDRRI
jgi:hypothetical protein